VIRSAAFRPTVVWLEDSQLPNSPQKSKIRNAHFSMPLQSDGIGSSPSRSEDPQHPRTELTAEIAKRFRLRQRVLWSFSSDFVRGDESRRKSQRQTLFGPDTTRELLRFCLPSIIRHHFV
jgi:hypothetical protein